MLLRSLPLITMKHKYSLYITISILLVCSICLYLRVEVKNPKRTNLNFPLTGNIELPQLASIRPEQIIEHLAYTVSYNHDWNLPNWVAYELTSEELYGDVKRSNHFAPDPLVSGDPVVTDDYSHSDYDRGHMAPAADMKWSEQAMRESFYMSNICPQNQNLNRGDWNDLEELARDWARKYGNL